MPSFFSTWVRERTDCFPFQTLDLAFIDRAERSGLTSYLTTSVVVRGSGDPPPCHGTGLRLDIEVVEIGELSGRKEVVAHITDGALDAALSFPRATATGRGS